MAPNMSLWFKRELSSRVYWINCVFLVGRLAGPLVLSKEGQGHKQRPEGTRRIDPTVEAVY